MVFVGGQFEEVAGAGVRAREITDGVVADGDTGAGPDPKVVNPVHHVLEFGHCLKGTWEPWKALRDRQEKE